MLRKVEAYLAPSKLGHLQSALMELGIEGMSVAQYRGYGTRSKTVDGKPQFEDKLKVEIVVDENMVDDLTLRLRRLSGAGEIGAGIIFVTPVEDAVRLSTNEAGKSALI